MYLTIGHCRQVTRPGHGTIGELAIVCASYSSTYRAATTETARQERAAGHPTQFHYGHLPSYQHVVSTVASRLCRRPSPCSRRHTIHKSRSWSISCRRVKSIRGMERFRRGPSSRRPHVISTLHLRRIQSKFGKELMTWVPNPAFN